MNTDSHAAPAAGAGARRARPPMLPLVLFALFAAVPLVASFGPKSFILALVTRIMVLGIAAMSLDLLIGYGAMISFGHAAFIGIGAYSVAILASHGINDGFIQLGAALIVSGLFALVTGAIS